MMGAIRTRGEIRGPVVTVQVTDSFDEALRTPVRIGLASVLTPSHHHARRAVAGYLRLAARTI